MRRSRAAPFIAERASFAANSRRIVPNPDRSFAGSVMLVTASRKVIGFSERLVMGARTFVAGSARFVRGRVEVVTGSLQLVIDSVKPVTGFVMFMVALLTFVTGFVKLMIGSVRFITDSLKLGIEWGKLLPDFVIFVQEHPTTIAEQRKVLFSSRIDFTEARTSIARAITSSTRSDQSFGRPDESFTEFETNLRHSKASFADSLMSTTCPVTRITGAIKSMTGPDPAAWCPNQRARFAISLLGSFSPFLPVNPLSSEDQARRFGDRIEGDRPAKPQ